jgi:hypothetical protein
MSAATIGTRVVLLNSQPQRVGTIMEVRREPYLKRYVVRADDSDETWYASDFELAMEGDPSRTPLGPPLHDA